jgi:hypothetical protein
METLLWAALIVGAPMFVIWLDKRFGAVERRIDRRDDE